MKKRFRRGDESNCGISPMKTDETSGFTTHGTMKYPYQQRISQSHDEMSQGESQIGVTTTITTQNCSVLSTNNNDIGIQHRTDGEQLSWRSDTSQAPINSSSNGPRGGQGMNKQIQKHQYRRPHNMSAIVNSDRETNNPTANIMGGGDNTSNQGKRSSTDTGGSFNGSGCDERRQIYRKGIINHTNKHKLQSKNYEECTASDNRTATFLTSSTDGTSSMKHAIDMYNSNKLSSTHRGPFVHRYRRNNFDSTITDGSSTANRSACNTANLGLEDDERLSLDLPRDHIEREDDLQAHMTSGTTIRTDYKSQRANSELQNQHHHHMNEHTYKANTLLHLNNNNMINDSLSRGIAVNDTATHLDSLSVRNDPDLSNLPSQASIETNTRSRLASSPSTFATATTPITTTTTTPLLLNNSSYLGNPPIRQLEDQSTNTLTMSQDSIQRAELRTELLLQAHQYRQLSERLLQCANSTNFDNLPTLLSSPLSTATSTSSPSMTQQQQLHNNLTPPVMTNNIINTTSNYPNVTFLAGLGNIDVDRFNTNASTDASTVVKRQRRMKEINLTRTADDSCEFRLVSQQQNNPDITCANNIKNVNTHNHLENVGTSPSLSQQLQQIDVISPTTGNEGHRGAMASQATTATESFTNTIDNNNVAAKIPIQSQQSNQRTPMNSANMMMPELPTSPYATADGNVLGGVSNSGDSITTIATNDCNNMPPLTHNMQNRQNKEAYKKPSSILAVIAKTTGASNNIMTPTQDRTNEEGGTEIIEHYTKRSYMPLGSQSDDTCLSDFLVFLRTNCAEVFEASNQAVKERSRYKQIFHNQVGIRCRFCAHIPYSQRGKRSSSFPQTRCRIYQSVTMMIRDHFRICKEMPRDIREEYDRKKAKTRRGGELEAKQYWIDSSKKLGLVDTPFGIFYQEKALKDDFQCMQKTYRKA